MDTLPILSLIIFLPLVGAAMVLTIRGEAEIVARNARAVALWTSLATFILSLALWAWFDPSNPDFQFVHEDDFVEACLAAMEKQVPGAFNIAGDGTLTIQEIAKKVRAIPVPTPAFICYPLMEMAWKMRLKGVETNSGVLDYLRYPFVGNNEKAKKELGFSPRYSSVQTLEETINARR